MVGSDEYQENPKIDQLIDIVSAMAHALTQQFEHRGGFNKADVYEYLLASTELVGLLLEDNNKYSQWSEARAQDMFLMMQEIANQNMAMKAVLAAHDIDLPQPKFGTA